LRLAMGVVEMRLSAPVYHLKRAARQLSREAGIPLHEALNRVATQEGFASWSLLAAKVSASMPHEKLFAQLVQGDMVLVAARPGQGKTQLSLKLAVETMKAGGQAHFLTMDCTPLDLAECFRMIGAEPGRFDDRFTFDASENISAAHIVTQLDTAPPGTLAVVDYLQLLDQKRENPPLMLQVEMLRAFAKLRGVIFVFISQISRTYDLARKPFPGPEDVRLPNPLDLSLFSKSCFLNNGEMRLVAA
jgi:replicative DNA helicase